MLKIRANKTTFKHKIKHATVDELEMQARYAQRVKGY